MSRSPEPSVDGYEILGLLGEGGMGTVWKARQVSLDRTVALKVLHEDLVRSRVSRERMRREARVAGRLDHPGLVRGIDMGESDGRLWFAMEFVPGETLRDRVRRDGGMEDEDVVDLGIQVARALRHAHGHGVVHRDIKPGNIMLAPDGTAKLTDLGLVRDALVDGLTRHGSTLGTPPYTAPEQVRAPSRAGIQADLYSLGATMFYAAVARAPFVGRNAAQVLASVLFDRAPDPRRFCDGMDRDLALVIRRLLSKEPTRRHPHPDALLEDLQSIREGGRSSAETRRAARGPWAAWAAVAGVGAVGLVWTATRGAVDKEDSAAAAGVGVAPMDRSAQAAVSMPPTPADPSTGSAEMARHDAALAALLGEQERAVALLAREGEFAAAVAVVEDVGRAWEEARAGAADGWQERERVRVAGALEGWQAGRRAALFGEASARMAAAARALASLDPDSTDPGQVEAKGLALLASMALRPGGLPDGTGPDPFVLLEQRVAEAAARRANALAAAGEAAFTRVLAPRWLGFLERGAWVEVEAEVGDRAGRPAYRTVDADLAGIAGAAEALIAWREDGLAALAGRVGSQVSLTPVSGVLFKGLLEAVDSAEGTFTVRDGSGMRHGSWDDLAHSVQVKLAPPDGSVEQLLAFLANGAAVPGGAAGAALARARLQRQGSGGLALAEGAEAVDLLVAAGEWALAVEAGATASRTAPTRDLLDQARAAHARKLLLDPLSALYPGAEVGLENGALVVRWRPRGKDGLGAPWTVDRQGWAAVEGGLERVARTFPVDPGDAGPGIRLMVKAAPGRVARVEWTFRWTRPESPVTWLEVSWGPSAFALWPGDRSARGGILMEERGPGPLRASLPRDADAALPLRAGGIRRLELVRDPELETVTLLLDGRPRLTLEPSVWATGDLPVVMRTLDPMLILQVTVRGAAVPGVGG